MIFLRYHMQPNFPVIMALEVAAVSADCSDSDIALLKD